MAKKRSSLKAKLEKMQGDWEGAEPQKGGGGVPDGNYTVRIESAVVGESKATSRLQIDWDCVVISPEEYEGKHIHKYEGIDEPDNLPWVQGTLETLELEIPEKLTDIGEVVEEAAGLTVEVTVQTRDEFTNIYFNELVESEEKPTGEDADEDYTEEDFDKMTRKELVEVVEEEKLDIDVDDFPKAKALREAVVEEYFEEE